MIDSHKIALEVIFQLCKKQVSFYSIKSIFQYIKNHGREILSGNKFWFIDDDIGNSYHEWVLNKLIHEKLYN